MPKTSFYSGTGITSEQADAIESSANAAAQSAADASTSEANALTSETNAASSAANALTSETNAAASASNASTSEANALASATAAQNLEITSASFDTTDGTLTLTKANSGTVTTDLDGRYADLSGATFTGDIDIQGNLNLRDTDRIILGDTIQDLYFSHRSDLGFGLVSEGTELRLRAPTVKLMSSTDVFLLGEDDTNGNPKVSLNYNNSERLVTTSGGIDVTGNIAVSGTVDGVDIATLATETYVDTAVSNLVDSAPATLDTLNELASALGDDANFSTTITNSLAGKANLSGADFTGDVTTTGDVGIGTDNPTGSYTKTLHIHGSNTGASLHLTDPTSGATASDGLEVFQYGTDGYVWEREAGSLRFGTSATERMRIDSSGNVGIGTSSPATNLHVAGGSSGTNQALFRTSSEGGGGLQIVCSDLSLANPLWSINTFYGEALAFGDGTNEHMRINASGRVGIGTNNPISPLQVDGTIYAEGGTFDPPDDGNPPSGSDSIDNVAFVMPRGNKIGFWHDGYFRTLLQTDTSGVIDIGQLSTAYITSIKLNCGQGGDVTIQNTDGDAGLTVEGSLTSSNITYPTTDGTSGQALVTDGNGNVSFGDVTVDVSGKADLSGATFTGNVAVGIPPSGTQSLTVAGVTNLYGGADLQNTNITDVDTLTAKNVDISKSGSVTTNIATGGGGTGNTKVLNLATGYGTGGSTTVNICPTSSTTTRNINLNGNVSVDGTVDGRDVATDGTKLDTLERVYRTRFRHRLSELSTFQNLTNVIADIGNPIYTKSTTGSENTLDFFLATTCSDYYDNNDGNIEVVVTAPNPSDEDVVNLGMVSNVVQNSPSGQFNFDVVGDVTKHLTDYCGMSVNSDGSNAFLYGQVRSNAYYNPSTNKTTISCNQYQSNKPVNGGTVYLHPFDWETSGTAIIGNRIQIDEVVYNAQKMSRKDFSAYLGYFKSSVTIKIRGKEGATTSDNIAIRKMEGTLTQVQD
jgi:hypothetical protein